MEVDVLELEGLELQNVLEVEGDGRGGAGDVGDMGAGDWEVEMLRVEVLDTEGLDVLVLVIKALEV